LSSPNTNRTPTGIPVKQGDLIRFGVWSSLNVTDSKTFGVGLSFNFVYPDGTWGKVDVPKLTTGTTRAQVGSNQAYTFASDGWLMSGAAYPVSPGFPSGTMIQRGQCYVAAWLSPKDAASDDTQLIGDYLYQAHDPIMGVLVSPMEGRGFLHTFSGATPAAGADIADTVPANANWLLYAIEAVLVTDATVANRTVNFFADDAASTVTRRLLLTDGTAQTATQTRTHGWYPGTDNDSTNSVSVTDTVTILAKYPMSLQNGVLLQKGCNLRTVTAGIDASDQWGAARYWVMEWLTGP
jgi:hypothetical protein